jgi:hypothetical protein
LTESTFTVTVSADSTVPIGWITGGIDPIQNYVYICSNTLTAPPNAHTAVINNDGVLNAIGTIQVTNSDRVFITSNTGHIASATMVTPIKHMSELHLEFRNGGDGSLYSFATGTTYSMTLEVVEQRTVLDGTRFSSVRGV